jgi:alpha-glucoside transport system permease protein
MQTAIRNSFIWVIAFPTFVTITGLIFAVLSEKVGWRTAFRLILFMPAAIAILSSGIIWRIMYETNPDRGAVNALVDIPVSLFTSEGDLAGASPSTDIASFDQDGLVVRFEVGDEGGTVAVGVIGIREDEIPASAVQASTILAEPPGSGVVAGVVWRDTRPGGGERGVVESGELGIPDVRLRLLDAAGSEVGSTVSEADGSFRLEGISPGAYSARIPSAEFRESWGGISWLGPELITLSAIVAGVWIWGGFALLIIASGLAAIPGELQEAARVDGANEWQVFRRVTVPLLAPVLGVVFVTLTINALKMFDLIVGIAPGSVQDEANVIALEMWRTAFTGLGNRGLGSAIAVFLFVLILPVMVFNIRRFRVQEGRR